MFKRLVLASASPRRQQLLRQIGLVFDIIPSEVNEHDVIYHDPLANVQAMALRKAKDVAARIGRGIVIGADTQVIIDGEVLGKPIDKADALRMLSKLSGRTHQVVTGVALVDIDSGLEETWVEKTLVTFRKLTVNEIYDYLETGEYIGKAGAYGIQEKAAVFVEKIEGCYFNVVGLPLAKLVQKIRKLQGLV